MLSPEHDAALLRNLAAMMEDSFGSPPPYRAAVQSLPAWVPEWQPLISKPVNECAQGQKKSRSRRAKPSYCIVEFKLGRRARAICPPELDGQLCASSYVILELAQSKGFDTAMFVSMLHRQSRGSSTDDDVSTIVRVATAEDCKVINNELPQLEQRAMTECQRLIYFLHLPFVCIDTEYTFDRSQVRVHYVLAPHECTTVIPNLSRLQRELSFSLKARVTLEQQRATA